MKKIFYLAFVAVVCSLLSCEKGFESKKESGDVVKINLPPANEVWYTSTTGDVIELSQYPYKLVSNTYRNGIGKYKFEQDVVNIGDYFGSKKNTDEILSQFKSLTLPSGITDINAYYAIGNLYNASSLILPENLKSIGCDFIGNFGKNLPEKHIYFLSQECPSYSMSYFGAFWNQSSVLFIHYPKGSDYSKVKAELEKWKSESKNFTYEMVETVMWTKMVGDSDKSGW